MKIEYREQKPTVEAYQELFNTTGWNDIYAVSIDHLQVALEGSWTTLCAYHLNQLVGFGRIVTDGALYAVIYDLIVLPAFQRKGIGSQILDRLTGKCRKAGIKQVESVEWS